MERTPSATGSIPRDDLSANPTRKQSCDQLRQAAVRESMDRVMASRHLPRIASDPSAASTSHDSTRPNDASTVDRRSTNSPGLLSGMNSCGSRQHPSSRSGSMLRHGTDNFVRTRSSLNSSIGSARDATSRKRAASGCPPLPAGPHCKGPAPLEIGQGKYYPKSVTNYLANGSNCALLPKHVLRGEGDSSSEEDVATGTENGLWARASRLFMATFIDMIHPTCRMRMQLDFLILILLVYICLASPYLICFGIEFATFSTLGCIEIGINLAFVWDMVLNFRTGYARENGSVSYSRKRVAQRYLSGWFIIDIVSIIPFDLMLTSESLGFVQLFKATRAFKLFKILRLLKIVKMLRLLKLPTLMRQLEYALGRGLMRICVLMSSAMLITHLSACFFYYVAWLDENGEDTWVSIAGLDDESNFTKYITALYWSMSTLTTVGYGDVIPTRTNEKVVALIAMAVGVTVFAYFMGAMGNMLSTMNSSQAQITRKMQMIDDFVRGRGVPNGLADRIRSFFSYVSTRQVLGDESVFLNELSVPLKTELVLFMYREALNKVPFFRGKDPQFIANVVTYLRLEYYAPGDMVVQQGEPGNVMYFVAQGQLEARLYFEHEEGYSEAQLNVVAELSGLPADPAAYKIVHPVVHIEKLDSDSDAEGADNEEAYEAWQRTRSCDGPYVRVGILLATHFGELSCLLGEPRAASIVAIDYCELYSFSRPALEQVSQIWPEQACHFDTLVDRFFTMGHELGENAPSVAIRARESHLNRTFREGGADGAEGGGADWQVGTGMPADECDGSSSTGSDTAPGTNERDASSGGSDDAERCSTAFSVRFMELPTEAEVGHASASSSGSSLESRSTSQSRREQLLQAKSAPALLRGAQARRSGKQKARSGKRVELSASGKNPWPQKRATRVGSLLVGPKTKAGFRRASAASDSEPESWRPGYEPSS